MGGPVWLRALLAQLGAAGILLLAFKLGIANQWGIPAELLDWLEGSLAVGLSLLLRLPAWWLPIQLLFVPALALSLRFDVSPWYGLAAFLLSWLLFRSNTRERVPLYLSNRTTWQAVADLLPQERPFRFADLGCGMGGGLAYLSARFPAGQFHGTETAPFPFLWAWLRLRTAPNARVKLGDLWAENLAAYDVVYAFLSPEPMPTLWNKVQEEMRPGSLFISNSFEVPGVKPDREWILDDRRETRLLLWRRGASAL